MEKVSQTLIGVVRRFVEAWRVQEGWTHQTLASELIRTHALMEGEQRTGICFDSSTQDIFIRSKINGERIQRWLDDESKCVNLMPANFLPVVLMAMPTTIRLQCVNELLHPLGLVACEQRPWVTETGPQLRSCLESLWPEDDEASERAQRDEASDPLSLELALRSLDDSIEMKQRIRHVVERALANYSFQNPYSRLL